jgi:c-di-GMP-binding flagellar brake protein YcgR
LAIDPRKSIRVAPLPTAPVRIQIMGSHSLDFTNAKDISAGGIGIYVPHGFEACNLESAVELVITLPGERSFSAFGILRHRSKSKRKGYFGIEFTQLSRAARALIEKYVANTLQIQAPE